MDHLWDVTIIPSMSSQAVSSCDVTAPTTRVLNTIKEHESKQDLYFPFDGNRKENVRIRRNPERSEIESLSSTRQRLNNPHNLRRPFINSTTRSTNALYAGGRESNDRMDEKTSRENNKHSGIRKERNNESSNQSKSPFIELGAVHKILDFITDSDPKVTSLTNSCCNEISRTLQCLIAQCRDRKLEDLLLNDSSLYRCERCGVISYVLGSRPVPEEIKGNRTGAAHGVGIMTAERDYTYGNQNNEKTEISRGSSDLNNNTESRIFVASSEIDTPAKCKDESKRIESLPIKERAFVTRNRFETPNGANNIYDEEANDNRKIKNTSRGDNNVIDKLFAYSKRTRGDKKYELDSNGNALGAMQVYTHDKEEIVRKISYENKWRIDNLPTADRRSKSAQKSQHGLQPFEKDEKNYSIADTVKYLARGRFTILDQEDSAFLSKLHEGRHIDVENERKRQSSVLYGSRDDYPQCESGFWLFDKSGRSPEISSGEYRHLSRPVNNSDDSHAKIPQRCNAGRNSEKTISWTESMERDSLESSTLLERRRESGTTTFSSSSAENLIREWMRSADGKEDINDTDGDIRRGRELVSSRPSLDIARHVRAEMADENRRSDNARKSICEPRARDSDVLIRLSPETRRKIYHLIQKLLLSADSAKGTTFPHEETTNTLKNEKLSHSKSMDATFVPFVKTFYLGNEITNTRMDDCIPTKLAESSKDKDRFINEQDNDVNTRSQSIDRSKNCAKTLHEQENLAAPVSSEELKKEVGDNSHGKIVRRIIYKDILPKNVVNNDDRYVVAETFSIYRNILESSKDMDWDSFRELVEILHPDQKELWRDVCKIVSEETRRVAGNDNTEVCIEIEPADPEETPKTGKVTACAREIVFELDLTLKNVESFLNKKPRLAEERLDIHKNVLTKVLEIRDEQ